MARIGMKKRWLRILEACRGPSLAESYSTNPRFQQDLEREAALGDKYFGAALLNTEMLTYFKDSIELPAQADGDPVVIVPGCLVTSLNDVKSGRWIWMNPANLAGDGICDLQLAPYDGSEQDAQPGVLIDPAGAFWCMYHTLNARLKARGFASLVHQYDWRKDVDYESSAQRLKNLILCLHADSNRPVHLVAHSLGGLVARRTVQCLCEEKGVAAAKQIVGKLVLLGPAVSGTFAAALGLAAAGRQLPFFGWLPPPSKPVQQTTRTWTTLYELLPWDDCLLPSLKKVGTFDFPSIARMRFRAPSGNPR
jgi:Alpha/beta hydrolase family